MHLVAFVEHPDHVCCRYRLRAFEPALQAAGHSLQYQHRPHGIWRSLTTPFPAGDACIVQRWLPSIWQLGRLRRNYRFVIFDFDDAVWSRDSYSPKGLHSARRLGRFEATVRAADLVIAGNRFLADKAAEFRHSQPQPIIPTCVEPANYRVAGSHPSQDAIRLVWLGSSSTLRGLEQIAPMLERIAEEVPGVGLKLICDRFLSLRRMPVNCCTWTEDSESAELADAEIGIAWMPDDDWSRGKCGLKVLQYMAAGLPVIANRVGVHTEMIQHGRTGFLANTATEWVDAVRTLANGAALRRKMGLAGRDCVERDYAVACGARAWVEALARLERTNNSRDAQPHLIFSREGSLATRARLASGRACVAKLPSRPKIDEGLHHANIDWTNLPPGLGQELGDPNVSLPQLVQDKTATIVKGNPHRTIYRVHLSGLDLHVKQCRVVGWRAWLRSWLRPAKAKLEYRRLQQAFKRGVPVVAPVGCGVARSVRDGQSYLVTRTVPDAVPLSDLLESTEIQIAVRRIMLARTLGQFLARVHAAGVIHPDPHPGNMLIRWLNAEPDLFLLDLHDARIGRPANAKQSLNNLILFNRWFIMRATRGDRLRFWKAYVAERYKLDRECGIDYLAARVLECKTARSNQRLWRSRIARCFGDNRRYQRITACKATGHAISTWQPNELDTFLNNPTGLFADGPLLKDSRSSTVALRTLIIGGKSRPVIVKRFRLRSIKERLRIWFRADACRRSWANGHAFHDCMLPTARPLAMFRSWQPRQPHDGYLISEYIAKATDLRSALLDANTQFSTRQGVRRERIDRVALLVRVLHERGWSHRDLKAANILLAPGARGEESAWFIDLVGACRPLWLTRSRRAKDIARLNASFHELPTLSRTDRLRFLRRYLSWNLHGQGDWKSWWKEIAKFTLRKVAQNKRRGRPLA